MKMHPSHQCLKCSAATVDILGCFLISIFFNGGPPPPKHRQRAHSAAAHPPSRLESEPGGVSPVAAQRAERPHDQFEARVVYVPQVDVLVRDLHGALSVDVQVRGGHQVHVETFWKTM